MARSLARASAVMPVLAPQPARAYPTPPTAQQTGNEPRAFGGGHNLDVRLPPRDNRGMGNL